MASYNYYTPTQVVLGADSELECGKLVQAHGGKKVLLHYGGKSAIASGLLARVEASLKEAGIAYVTLGGVVPNPRLSKVYEGIALCKAEGVDFILAVGGGSVIDSCKAIGYGLANEGDVWDFYLKKRTPTACMPVACVLTIAAAGSEMSNSSVITNEETMLKRGCNTDYARCKFAIMNPSLTTTLPAYQTASGCVDILMHTMERYFHKEHGLEMSDSIAEALLRTVIASGTVLMDDPQNYDARAEVMWASSLSHNGLTGFGGNGGDWACHQMEHEISGMFDVAHGAGLSAIWGTWARTVSHAIPERFVRFAKEVFGIDTAALTQEESILAGIEAMEGFFKSIGMPTSISALGVHPTDEQIAEMALKCSFYHERTVGNVVALDYDAMEKIYHAAL